MAGSHYELDRERIARLRAERPPTKACKRCLVVQANDYEHFGKKWDGDRTHFTTVDVCNACRSARHKENWAKRHQKEAAYRLFKANGNSPTPQSEALMKGAAPEEVPDVTIGPETEEQRIQRVLRGG